MTQLHGSIPANSAVLYSESVQAAIETKSGTQENEKSATIKRMEDKGILAPWGDNNTWPQQLIEDVRKSDLIPMIVEQKTKLLYSGGVVYGKLNVVDGVETMERMAVPEIDEWLKKTRINRYLYEAGYDKYMFYNFFPELVLNDKKSMITRIYNHDASECRLGRQKKSGKINKVFLSANWDGSQKADNMLRIDALDPYYDVADQIRRGQKIRYILPMRTVHMGNKYYDIPTWNGVRVSKWFALSQSIPEFKINLMKNQMTIKYHIEIDEAWWAWRFKGWGDLKNSKREELMKDEVKSFEKFMKGEKKAGNTLLSSKRRDPHDKGMDWSSWTIHEMKFQLPDGAYVEDSQEADFHIARAHGIDPTLIGISPSRSKTSSGSGSDKRVARLNHLMDSKSDQDQILEPLQVISEYNGWDKKHNDGAPIHWWCKNYFVATLDRSSSVQENPEDD